MGADELERSYARFAGLVHFLDPSKDVEEDPLKIDLTKYHDALKFFDENDVVTVEQLVNLFERSPEAIHILELILQLSNFTTAQRTFMMFDLRQLNSPKLDTAVEYILRDLMEDSWLREFARKEGVLPSDIVPEIDELPADDKLALLARSKKMIAKCCSKRDANIIVNRLKNSEHTRQRIAVYLIENRALNEVLRGIKPSMFIKNKRIPRDTKSAHGKYAASMVEEILEDAGFQCRNDTGIFGGKMLARTGTSQQTLEGSSERFYYCTEKEVESVSKPGTSISSESLTSRSRQSKRFDFVLLYDNQPKIVIEVNFYTTSGSKIGINEKEYLALHRKISEQEHDLRFIWITDG
ncbi:MAG: DpnII family type II restriction endonuclease, partial [Candidatus Thorarchaeota archaeon]